MRSPTIINTTFSNPATRVETDYYPTPPEVTHALMKFLQSVVGITLKTCHEPACGEGDMSEVIAGYGVEVFSSDLIDRGYGKTGIDYLKYRPAYRDAVITNPPFSLSEQFIEKAVKESGIVCMLLKANYFHASRRLQMFKNNPPAYVLPLTWRPNWYFKKQKGSSPTMDVSWYVWLSGMNETKYLPVSKPSL